MCIIPTNWGLYSFSSNITETFEYELISTSILQTADDVISTSLVILKRILLKFPEEEQSRNQVLHVKCRNVGLRCSARTRSVVYSTVAGIPADFSKIQI